MPPPPPPPPPPSVPPPGVRPPPKGDIGVAVAHRAAAVARAAIQARETGILNLENAGLAKFPVGVIKLASKDVLMVDISNNQLDSLPRVFGTFNKGTGLEIYGFLTEKIDFRPLFQLTPFL